MAYDEALGERIGVLLEGQQGVVERNMFSCLASIVSGNMSVGITGDDLMVRVGADGFDDAISQPHARPMDFTGRPIKGFVYVDAADFSTDDTLAQWMERGVSYARSLPAK